MTPDKKTDGWSIVWETLVVLGIVVAIIAVGFFVPAITQPAKRGWLTDNLNNAHQVALALQMYAGDNEEHQFPQTLEEIMPKYCTDNRVLLNTVADGKSKVPWKYFPGHKSNEEPVVIVLTSQPDSKGERVVAYSDGRAVILEAQSEATSHPQ